MKILVTGGAGFIASQLSAKLLARGDHVVIYDNFSTGQREFAAPLVSHANCSLVEADLLDLARIREAVTGCEAVFHLAANADVRFGFDDPYRDLNQNVIATHNVLEAMRGAGVKRLVFSSTSAAIGEPDVHPTPENLPMPVQTSLYGASKAAAEGFVTGYANGYGMSALIFRFVSVLGPHYTHGHVFDFVRHLLNDPSRLPILGDGEQRKSYMHVHDCVAAILHTFDAQLAEKSENRSEIFNLGTDEYCQVKDSARWISDEMGLSPRFEFAGGRRGWVGDNPFVFLDTRKVLATGWAPAKTIEQSVRDTVRWLLANRWVFEKRA